MSLGCTKRSCVWLPPNRGGTALLSNEECCCLDDVKRGVGFIKGVEIEREIRGLVAALEISEFREDAWKLLDEEKDPCACCHDRSNCSGGCECWESCEVNEGFDEYNERDIQLPCEYGKGHKGRHLHHIGTISNGVMSDIHPIWWERGE